MSHDKRGPGAGSSVNALESITRHSPGRIVAVTIGLSLAGAIFGGIAGGIVLGIVLLVSEDFDRFGTRIFLVAATLGAMLGAACAPVAGWLLLRRVPLGRAFGGLTIGTILGGVFGWFLPISMNKGDRSLIAGAVGFLCAAVWLRSMHTQARSDQPSNDR